MFSSKLRTLSMITFLLVLLALPLSAQQSSTVSGYTVTFDGVQYDTSAGTSTWNYTIVWDESVYKHELSHLTIGICSEATVVSATPGGYEAGPDGSTGVFGIKWEQKFLNVQNGIPVSVSFTLDGLYAVGSVGYASKSKDDNIGTIDGPTCLIANPSLSVTKNCVPDVFVGDQITYDLTVTNTGNVALQDVVVDDALIGVHTVIPLLGAGGQWATSGGLTPTGEGTIVNTVTAAGHYWNLTPASSASCSTNVHKLTVVKTAQTSYTRNWDWTWNFALRSGQAATTEICSGQTRTIGFTGTASRVAVDSNFAASGTITVSNSAPIAATIEAITDDLAGQPVPVVCGSAVAFPFSLAANSSVTCSYTATLPNANDRLNVATATISNGTGFSGNAAVTFGDPSPVLDATATASFNVVCPTGFTCTNVDPLTFSGNSSAEIDVTVSNVSAECDITDTLNVVSTLTEPSGRAQSKSASAAIYTCPCSTGCTLTIGFWKTHAGFTGNNADRVTEFLPIWLGTSGGLKSVQVLSATSAVNILGMGLGDPSNGITKLYAQLLGAKLNIARGASSTAIASALAAADSFLSLKNQLDWAGLSKTQKNQVIGWMSKLDTYNNGLIGPGHCN